MYIFIEYLAIVLIAGFCLVKTVHYLMPKTYRRLALLIRGKRSDAESDGGGCSGSCCDSNKPSAKPSPRA